MTWAGRILSIIGPVIAYVVTYRLCLGLQHSDRAVLEHGIETGILKRLPSGEFIEIHQPLGPVDDHGHPMPLAYQGAPVPKRMNQLGSAGIAVPGLLTPAKDDPATSPTTTTRSMPWKRSSRASNTDPVHPPLCIHARDKGPAPERSGRGFCRVWAGEAGRQHTIRGSSARLAIVVPTTHERAPREQRTPSMNMQTTRRITAVSMASAATLAIAGFTALGSIFDYPKILKAPTDEILAAFRDEPGRDLRLVPGAGNRRGAARAGRDSAGPDRRRHHRPVDRRRGHRRGDRSGGRPVPLGAADPRRQRRRRPVPALAADARHTFEHAALLARHHRRRDHRLRPDRYLHRARCHRARAAPSPPAGSATWATPPRP